MKKTQFKDALKNVQKQIVSFLSIVLVIALGTGLYLVCRMGGIATAAAGNRFFTAQNFNDIEIKATRGVTPEDVEAVKEFDFVTDAEGIISVEMVAGKGNARSAVKVISATERIDLPVVLSGKMPQNEGECIVSADLSDILGVSIGDSVNLKGSGSLPKFLKTYSYTVTGIMNHPNKIRSNEISSPTIILSANSFDTDSLGVEFTGIVMRVEADANAFSDAYKSTVKEYGNDLTLFGRERAKIRDEEVVKKYKDSISAGEKQLADAAKFLGEAGKKLDEAEETLKKGESLMALGDTAVAFLEAYMDAIKDKLGLPVEAIRQLVGSLGIGGDGETEEEKEKISLLESYKNAEQFVLTIKDMLSGKISEYEAGLALVSDGRAALAEKLAEYTAGEVKLNAAKEELANLENGKWIVLTRYQNRSFYEMGETINTFNNIGSSFAVMFMALGVLVCYATIGKIIDEQRKLVGTTKAIGFKRSEIFGKYLVFGVGGASLGSVAGSLIAFFILQPLMVSQTEITYVIGSFDYVFEPVASLIALVITALVGAVATYFACSRLLKKPAIKLLNGEIKGTGNKEKTVEDGGKRKSLYAGLIFRNMREDAKRVMITIASIAGCTILLYIGFSLKMSFDNIIKIHFGETVRYESTVSFMPDTAGEAEKSVGNVIDKYADAKIAVYNLNTLVRIGGETETAQITCADPDDLLNFCSLYDVTKNRAARIPDGGVMIFSRLAEIYKLGIGDSISILGSDGVYREVTVTGIYNSYSGRSIFMSRAYGEKVFGTTCITNAFAVKNTEEELADLKKGLAGEDSFVEIITSDDLTRKSRNAAATMNIVVYVMIVMSAIMAGVVLLNLVRIQINQKKNELIVMRINGFTIWETAGYILKENMITTAAGIVLGLGLGTVISKLVLNTVERVDLQMIREVSVPSLIFSALITLFFAAVINFIALRSIRKLKLTRLD